MATCNIIINSCVTWLYCKQLPGNCESQQVTFFGVYFGFLGNGMGPRRRHQEVLSKQREDRGNFKPPGSLLNRHISNKMLTAHWLEWSGIVEGLWEGNMLSLLIQYF